MHEEDKFGVTEVYIEIAFEFSDIVSINNLESGLDCRHAEVCFGVDWGH